uniref:Uncharacterized protein n=1 Tax=Anopheles coluzzii TaxID=1518534 RepID=A0A8W7PZH2_ANOCL
MHPGAARRTAWDSVEQMDMCMPPSGGPPAKMVARLLAVPKKNPQAPNAMISASFSTVQRQRSVRAGQSVSRSISGGKTSASVEVETAPTSEMKVPRFGMIAASTNVSRTVASRSPYSASARCRKWRVTAGASIVIGT